MQPYVMIPLLFGSAVLPIVLAIRSLFHKAVMRTLLMIGWVLATTAGIGVWLYSAESLKAYLLELMPLPWWWYTASVPEPHTPNYLFTFFFIVWGVVAANVLSACAMVFIEVHIDKPAYEQGFKDGMLSRPPTFGPLKPLPSFYGAAVEPEAETDADATDAIAVQPPESEPEAEAPVAQQPTPPLLQKG